MNTVEILHLLPYLASLGLSLVALLLRVRQARYAGHTCIHLVRCWPKPVDFAFILEVLPWGLQEKSSGMGFNGWGN